MTSHIYRGMTFPVKWISDLLWFLLFFVKIFMRDIDEKLDNIPITD